VIFIDILEVLLDIQGIKKKQRDVGEEVDEVGGVEEGSGGRIIICGRFKQKNSHLKMQELISKTVKEKGLTPPIFANFASSFSYITCQHQDLRQ